MACISGESLGKGLPFMLRVMQELMRSSMLIGPPDRALYCGNSSQISQIGRPNFFVPAFK